MALRHTLWIALLLLVGACLGHAGPLTIIYTNDLHLRFDRLGTIEAAIAAERATGNPVLVLDAGDAWHDFRRPIDAVWGAEAMIDWMNRVGYDAMALGNHELYLGRDRVADLIERADFPVLSANVSRVHGDSTPWTPAVLIDVGGLSVRIVGLTTGELLPTLDDPWLRRVSPESSLLRCLAEEPPADLTIALGHVSLDEASLTSERVAGIDLFLTGHSHEQTALPRWVGQTAIVQAGAFARFFGRLRLNIEPDGSVEILEHALLPTEKAPSERTQGLGQLLRVGFVLTVSVLLLLL